jgi:hypothetical protein
MWLMDHFFAPDLPTRQRYYYIEAAHKIALYEWLIRWAEMVEACYDDLYSCYPFACHAGPEPVRITLRNARRTLATLLCEPDADSMLPRLDSEITRLANALASWRGKPAPPCWNNSSFHDLTDLTKYEP